LAAVVKVGMAVEEGTGSRGLVAAEKGEGRLVRGR